MTNAIDRRRFNCILLSAPALGVAGYLPASARDFIEPPYLKDQIEAKRLPPLQERIPVKPRVIDLERMGRKPGRYGGQIRMLMGDPKDVRMVVVYGYARLVGYDENLNLVPDILENFEVEDGRIFTLRIRPGHRWSDGHPFTAEDFRYFWEDIANNEKLSLTGPPAEMLVDGKPPVFEVLDECTVRYTWPAPNPAFIPALAGALPLYIYAPSHYLKQFHVKYAHPAELELKVTSARVRDWTSLHERMGRMYRPQNPDLPCLDAWCLSTAPPSTNPGTRSRTCRRRPDRGS